MKRIIAILVLCLISVFSLVGCRDSYEREELDNYADTYFVMLLENENKILVHKETKVMYLFVKDGYGAGLCVMVDQCGKPLLWQGE